MNCLPSALSLQLGPVTSPVSTNRQSGEEISYDGVLACVTVRCIPVRQIKPQFQEVLTMNSFFLAVMSDKICRNFLQIRFLPKPPQCINNATVVCFSCTWEIFSPKQGFLSANARTQFLSMVSVLDLDFTTLLSSSFSDFSPSGSSDTDTIFSSPSHTHNFDFQNFTIENAFADIPSWEPSVPESDAFSDPESAIVVKQEPTEDTVSLPSQSVLSESLENTFVKPEPDTAVHTTSRPQRKPRAKRRKVDSHKEVSTVSSSSHHTTSEPRLILSREELLTLTSSQYEAIIAQVRTSRELTAAEKRDVKRQRRLIKNRESAQASRQRKKTYVEELERRLAEVSSENTLLRQTSLIVQNENALLRAENEYIKGKTYSQLILNATRSTEQFWPFQRIESRRQRRGRTHPQEPTHNICTNSATSPQSITS